MASFREQRQRTSEVVPLAHDADQHVRCCGIGIRSDASGDIILVPGQHGLVDATKALSVQKRAIGG